MSPVNTQILMPAIARLAIVWGTYNTKMRWFKTLKKKKNLKMIGVPHLGVCLRSPWHRVMSNFVRFPRRVCRDALRAISRTRMPRDVFLSNLQSTLRPLLEWPGTTFVVLHQQISMECRSRLEIFNELLSNNSGNLHSNAPVFCSWYRRCRIGDDRRQSSRHLCSRDGFSRQVRAGWPTSVYGRCWNPKYKATRRLPFFPSPNFD